MRDVITFDIAEITGSRIMMNLVIIDHTVTVKS